MTKTPGQDAAAREHRRKFRIDGVHAQRQLATALKAIEANKEAVERALEHISAYPGSAADVTDALKILVGST